MNPNEINIQPPKLFKNFKKNLKRVVMIAGAVCVTSVAAYASIDPLADLNRLESEYELAVSKRERAAEQYDIAQQEWCESRIDLAKEKLSLYYKQSIDLEQHDVDRLTDLTKNGCNYHTEPVGLAQEPSPSSETEPVHIDKLAYAIAMAETHNCTKGYGQMYNNCFGIKNGSIAPCDKIGNNKMCIYNNPEESYAAFKKIWTQGYGAKFPSHKAAKVWTGNHNPNTWLTNVKYYYENYSI